MPTTQKISLKLSSIKLIAKALPDNTNTLKVIFDALPTGKKALPLGKKIYSSVQIELPVERTKTIKQVGKMTY